MTVSEKAAYIKGLIEGMKIDTSDGEGKVISAMADLLEDLSLSVLDLEDETATLNDYVEEIDEDLGAVEEELYCDCECLELECPACGKPVYIDECDADEIDELECPNCGKLLSLVQTDDEDESEEEDK